MMSGVSLGAPNVFALTLSFSCLMLPLTFIIPQVAEMLFEAFSNRPIAHKVVEELMVLPSLQNTGQFARIR